MAGLLLVFLMFKFSKKLTAVAMYFLGVAFQTIGLIGFLAICFANNNEPISNNNFTALSETRVTNVITNLYILVAVGMLVKLVLGLKKIYQPQLLNDANNHPFNEHVWQLVKHYLPNKNVMIKWVNTTTTVFTYGFLKPVIVLPIASINDLTEEEFTAIVLHEIAHIKMAHFILNIWVEIVSALLWFNPFNFWLHKEINFYREASADAFVVQQTNNTYQYANGLYKLALQQIKPKLLLSLPAVKNEQELLQRILFFTQQKLISKFSFKYSFIAFFVVICFFVLQQFSVNKRAEIVLKPNNTLGNETIQISNKETSTVVANIKDVKKVIAKKITAKKPTKNSSETENIYKLEDKEQIVEGLKFLSDLAIENPTIQKIINNNPTIIPVAFDEHEKQEMVRRFIIPATETKGVILVKITVEPQPNKKEKVIIELQELPHIQES